MAEEALKKLEEQLCCSICLDTFTDPKLLQCFHVYCHLCLVPLVTRDQQGSPTLTCPTCRQITPISARGVAGLQSAFHINHLLEIQNSFQKQGATALSAEVSLPGKCSEHREELKLYCEACQKLACFQCLVKGERHYNHDCVELDLAFEEYKDEIVSRLMPRMENQVAAAKKALAQLNIEREIASNQRSATEENIHTTFRQLRQVMNQRETNLIDQLHQMTQVRLKDLTTQSDQIETTLAQLTSCLHYMRESLKPGNEEDVLKMKTSTIKRVQELADISFQPSGPSEADIVFSTSEDVVRMCETYGVISVPECEAEEGDQQSLHEVYCQSANNALQILRDSPQLRPPAHQLRCSPPLRPSAHQLRCSSPSRPPAHQPRCSSPQISAMRPLAKVIPGVMVGEVLGPCGVAVSHRGTEMVITEWGGDRVSIFNLDGKRLQTFGTSGCKGGDFNGPRGVAVDGDGNILVVDYWNNRIQKFSSRGEFLMTVGTKGKGPLQFLNPTGIAFSTISSKIYITDWANHRVQVLNSNFTFFSSFGNEGSGKAQFSYPCGVALDKYGNIYVADSGNHRIQVFSAQGDFLRMFGCFEGEVGKKRLNYPNGLAIDVSGLVYVSDGENYQVMVFTPEGHLVTSFGRKGVGLGEFDWPCGLVVGSKGVHVCDYTNNRVQTYSKIMYHM